MSADNECRCGAIVVTSIEDTKRLLAKVEDAATCAREWLRTHSEGNDSLDLFRHLKFEPVGSHPATGKPLNLIEQINQTWSFVVAIVAARKLLELHPRVGGFCLAPGAHASLPFDIVSKDGSVVAETFAAVTPENNGKLSKDREKLSRSNIPHRYVFFMSPKKYPGTQRCEELERDGDGVQRCEKLECDGDGVQVWCVDQNKYRNC